MAVKSTRAAAPAQAAAFNPLAALLTFGAWLLLLLGERVLSASDEGLTYLLSGAGVLGVLAGFAQRLWALATAMPDRKASARAFAVLSGLGLLALATYFATTSAGREALGINRPKLGEPDTFGDVATVVWVGLLTISLVATALGELARRSMLRAERVESRRVMAAVTAGVTVALVAIYGALFAYGAAGLDWRVDFSYFRTARPGSATRNMLNHAEGDPVQALAFFPSISEVRLEVIGYLQDLRATTGDRLTIEDADPDLYPDLAKEHKLSKGGVILLKRGELSAKVEVGDEMARAQRNLKNLDAEMQKALQKVLRETLTVYLTVGHGEVNTERDANSPRNGSILRQILEKLNYKVKNLGLKEGLGEKVPDDAAMVLIVGPTEPFHAPEIDSLQRYADHGGSVFMALDPEAKVDLEPLAAVVGLTWQPNVVLNEQVRFPRTRSIKDKKEMVIDRFSSHASVSTLSKLSARGMAVLMSGAAPLDKRSDASADLRIDFPLKSPPKSYVDLDGKFSFDKDTEKEQTFNLAAAVTRKTDESDESGAGEMRAFVMSDADALTDELFKLTRQSNVLLFAEAVRWLGREASFSGETETEEDHPIVHTKAEDQLYFYGAILGVPSLVLGLGLLVSRRSRRAEESSRRGALGASKAPRGDAPPEATATTGRKKKKTRPTAADEAVAAADEVADDAAETAPASDGLPASGKATGGDDPGDAGASDDQEDHEDKA